MIRFRLSPEDCARLGAPAELEYDETRLMLSEARELQKATGLHPGDISAALSKGDADAIAGIVWLALKRKGVMVAYEELDFDLAGFEEIPDDAGKDPSSGATTST